MQLPNIRRKPLFVALVALPLVAILILAAFPWGLLRAPLESRLSERIGKQVRIERLRRLDVLSFTPRLEASGIVVPQPGWASSREPRDLARVESLRLSFSALHLLAGRFRPRDIAIEGGAIHLYRSADGRSSWTGGKGGGGSPSGIASLTIGETSLTYLDDKRQRQFDLRLSSDGRGLRVEGDGRIMGNPVTLSASGPPPAAGAWPFRFAIEGKAVGLTAEGTMDAPLDVGRFTARITAHGDDLRLVDAIIEAGLFPSQPVQLSADVRHDGGMWKINGLKGAMGRSRIEGDATVRKQDGRTRIDGKVHALALDFDDLSSDEGLRIAAEKRRRFGPRLVPDTQVDLRKLMRTDGKLDIRVDRLLWAKPSPLQSLTGTLTLDHGRLRLSPATVSLPTGRLSGEISVTQKENGPIVAMDLKLDDARLADFFPRAGIDGKLQARLSLQGPGRTIREAVGRSDGFIGIAGREGVIPARTAFLLGQDVGRGITADSDSQATLRCAVARFAVKAGSATADPVVIDTSRARSDVTGHIKLSDETLALAMNGAPKNNSLLRMPGTIGIEGTIREPDIRVPEGTKSVGGVIRMLGNAIAGKQGPTATDADCAALTARALAEG